MSQSGYSPGARLKSRVENRDSLAIEKLFNYDVLLQPRKISREP